MLNRCLVTGGTGFIGSHLLSFLHRNNIEINLISRCTHGIGFVNNYICDLSNEDVPHDAINNVDAVFYLAGIFNNKSAQYSDYYNINVNAPLSLLNLSIKNRVKSFIYVSSVKAGMFDACASTALPKKNTCEYFYAKSKFEAEKEILEVGKNNDINVSIIRPSLVYGSGVNGNLQRMIWAIKNKKFPPIPDTNNKRSMVHVDDLIEVIYLSSIDERANGEIFIVTDLQSYSTKDIYLSILSGLAMTPYRWSVPKSIFYIVSKVGDIVNKILPFPFDSNGYCKLFNDEFYYSNKVQLLLGYTPKRKFYSSTNEMTFGLNTNNDI